MQTALAPRLRRIHLVHGPTPLVRNGALSKRFRVDLWIKRDDATAGAEAGNKIRKLEFLLGDAISRGADTIITCGGIQSNHARATAIACAQLGLSCILLLRVDDDGANDPTVRAPASRLPLSGNVLLDRMVGAEIRLISRALYDERSSVMEAVAREARAIGRAPYVVPEGGSSGLGALGYVDAMREIREQLDAGLGGDRRPFDVVVHACGSGGTAAGVALGASRYNVSNEVRAIAVCNDAVYFERIVRRIVGEARGYDPSLERLAPLTIDEWARGPRYGEMDSEQKRFLVDIARASGILADPVYTGKALFGLAKAIERGEIAEGARVLFLHTGGLPGLLAQGDALAESL